LWYALQVFNLFGRRLDELVHDYASLCLSNHIISTQFDRI
jgi:hypothetical protein